MQLVVRGTLVALCMVAAPLAFTQEVLSQSLLEKMRARAPGDSHTFEYEVQAESFGLGSHATSDPAPRILDHDSKRFAVTFSVSPRAIYYRSKQIEPPPPDQHSTARARTFSEVVVFFNGLRTYRLLDGQLTIYPGKQFRDIQFPPLFGLSVLGAPLFRPIKGAAPAETGSSSDRAYPAEVYFQPGTIVTPSYLPGIVLTDTIRSRHLLKGLYAISVTQPFHTVIFKYDREWKGFQDIASQTTITRFLIPDPNGKPSKVVESKQTLELKSAVTSYCGFETKVLVDRLRHDDAIIVTDAKGTTRVIRYDKRSEEIRKLFEDPEGIPLMSRLFLSCMVAVSTFCFLIGWRAFKKGALHL